MKYTLFLLLFSFSILPTVLYAQLTGGAYEIYGDTFSFVSGNGSTGGIYDLYDTGGEFFAASSGGGDYALRGGYRAIEKGILRVEGDTSDIDYGVLTIGDVASSTILVTVWTDTATGYTLLVREDQNPTAPGPVTIADVADALVDGSTEEYGMAVTGADTLITPGVDIAITNTNQAVASSPGIVEGRTTELLYKVAIDAGTADGVYSHTLIHTVLVNP